jgi:hypothetical protein
VGVEAAVVFYPRSMISGFLRIIYIALCLALVIPVPGLIRRLGNIFVRWSETDDSRAVVWHASDWVWPSKTDKHRTPNIPHRIVS